MASTPLSALRSKMMSILCASASSEFQNELGERTRGISGEPFEVPGVDGDGDCLHGLPVSQSTRREEAAGMRNRTAISSPQR